MKINKKVILPIGLSSILVPQIGNADTTMFDNSDVTSLGKVDNKTLTRGSVFEQSKTNSLFRGYFNGGMDMINVPYNRPHVNASAMLYAENNERYSYGSAMFVSPRVMVTAAHLFLNYGNKTGRREYMFNSLKAVLGHNSEMVNGKISSGNFLNVSADNIKFWNENDFSLTTPEGIYKVKFYNDLAVVILPKPMQLVSPDKQAEFNDLATDDEIDAIKDGDIIRYIGYPKGVKKGDEQSLKQDIIQGRLYEVSAVVSGYTNPETGKPYYKSSSTGEDNPYYPLAHFNGSGLPGFSGSGVLNSNYKVVGVFQSGRSTIYEGGPNKGKVVPDSDANVKSSGGMFFTKAQRDWIRGIIEQNKVTGFYQDVNIGNKYYFGEDQHMVRNITKVIDNHTYSFNNEGVVTDLGEVKKGNVYIKYVLDTGEEFMRPIKYITNEVVGESIDYNYKHDPILNKHEFIKYKEYKVKSVDNANGKVVEGDSYVTVRLTKNYDSVNIAKLRKINDNINTYLTSSEFNKFLDFKSKSLPKNIKDELLVKHQELVNENNKLEEYLNKLLKQISDDVTQDMIDKKVSEYNKKMDDFTSFVHNAEVLYDKIVEYKDVYDKKKQLIDTIPHYNLNDKDYIKSGVDYDNFTKLHSTLSDLTIKDDFVLKDVERLIDIINNLDENQINKYKEAFEKLQYKDIVKKQEDVSFDIKYEGVKNKDNSYDVITKGKNGKVEIVKITIKQGTSGKVINTTEERNVIKNMISEVRRYKDQPKDNKPVEQPKDNKPVEQPKDNKPVEQPKDNKVVEQPKDNKVVEQPKDNKVVEQPKDNKVVEQPKDNKVVEQPKDNKTVEQAKDNKVVEQPKDNKVVEQPKDNKTVEQPKDNKTVEQPKDNKTVEQAKDNEVVEQAKDNKPVEQPKDNKVVEQPKDNKVVEQPKDNKTVEQAKDNKVVEQPKDNKTVEQAKDNKVVEQPKVETLKGEPNKVVSLKYEQTKEQSKVNNNDILARRKLLPETGDTNGLGNLGLAGLGVVFGLWLTRRNEKVNRRYKRF